MTIKHKVVKADDLTIHTITSKEDRCSIGYRRINKMVQVAVSYCDPADKFKHSTGREIVSTRLAWVACRENVCGVISIPNKFEDENDLQEVLKFMFFGFYPEE